MSTRFGLTGRRSRALAVATMAAPLLATVLVTTSSPAAASGTWTSNTPSDGAVLTGGSFTVGAVISAGSNAATLTLTGTDTADSTCTAKTSSRGGAFSQQTTISISVPNSSCSSARNARWTATLSGGASGSRTFYTNEAPATPSSFDAEGSGARDVSFTWDRGNEPDLTGYGLWDGSGNPLAAIGLDHCNGSLCTYAIYYPSDSAGTHSFQLAARRASAGCSSCGSYVESGRASASATLVNPPPPPPPSPTPTPTPTGGTGGTTTGGSTGTGSTGGTTGGSTGGTTGGTAGSGSTGGSTGSGSTTGGVAVKPTAKPTIPSLPQRLAASRRNFALNFRAFAPSLGIPKLPPLASLSPTVGGPAPLPLGTYSPTLPYQPQTETVKTTSVIRQITGVGSTVDWGQLAKSLACALILLLAGAHLRRFLAVRSE
jgi:hypothetical protein